MTTSDRIARGRVKRLRHAVPPCAPTPPRQRPPTTKPRRESLLAWPRPRHRYNINGRKGQCHSILNIIFILPCQAGRNIDLLGLVAVAVVSVVPCAIAGDALNPPMMFLRAGRQFSTKTTGTVNGLPLLCCNRVERFSEVPLRFFLCPRCVNVFVQDDLHRSDKNQTDVR